MGKENLPIGSVVILNDGTKKIMITGHKTIDDETKKEFEYNGCIWPEGYMENIFCLFNSDEIKQVFFRGYENKDLKPITQNNSQLSNKAGGNDYYEEKYKPGRPAKKPNIYTTAEEMMEKYGETVSILDEMPEEIRTKIMEQMEEEK